MSGHAHAEEVRALVAELFAGLDHLPYYAFLGVSPRVREEALREAFYRRAAMLHPDRFHLLDDAELRNQIYAVYKRIAEAYRVLQDPAARAAYDTGVRAGQHRFVRDERARTGPPPPDEGLTNPQAKRLLRLGLEALKQGDLKGARASFVLAQQLEPRAEAIGAQLRALDEKPRGR